MFSAVIFEHFFVKGLITLAAPFKSMASIWSRALRCVWPTFVLEHVVKVDKSHLNAPILGRFKGCGYNSRATFNGAGTLILSMKYHFPISRIISWICCWKILASGSKMASLKFFLHNAPNQNCMIKSHSSAMVYAKHQGLARQKWFLNHIIG